jgi:transcription elongation factor Elf1
MEEIAQELREAIDNARNELRKKVKCPLCGRKTAILTEEREANNIGDEFMCKRCGLIFYIP